MDDSSVASIARALASASIAELPTLISRYRSDPRRGVTQAVTAAHGRLQRFMAEEARVRLMGAREQELHDAGVVAVAGVDEVGRGALAGPVTAAAVILPSGVVIHGLNDSKRVPRAKRPGLAEAIRAQAHACAVAHVEARVIDAVGIAQATRIAMSRALDALEIAPQHVLVDGLPVDLGRPSTAIIKGDTLVCAIAAASVVAKVERDALMVALDAEYPGYDFADNKGYGCAQHLDALRTLGPSPIHRMSFSPCAQQSLL
ncbi:MAG: ribonuclease HII [Coriobacteriales bacterium]